MPLQSIAKEVLLLRLVGGSYLVCDEYWPSDGRIHSLKDACYGTFDLQSFIVEIRKAAIDVASVVYRGTDWPSPIAGSKDIPAILSHFGCHDD